VTIHSTGIITSTARPTASQQQHGHDNADQGKECADHLGERLREEVVERFDVVHQAAHQVAGLLAFQELQIQAFQLVKTAGAASASRFGPSRDDEDLEAGGHHADHINPRQQQHGPRQARRVACRR
jgi:hypothetical protein